MMDQYLKQFEENFQKSEPAWMQQHRRQAMDRCVSLGFPSTDWEEWRFTNLQPLAEGSFQSVKDYHPNGLTLEKLSTLPLHPSEGCQMVFVNGHFAKKLSRLQELPSGVRVESLKQILEREPSRLEPYLAQIVSYQDHPFAALNTALASDGAYIHIPKGTILKAPIHLLFLSHPNGEPTVSHPRNLIIAEAESQAVIVENYLGLGRTSYFTNATTEILAGEGTLIDYSKIQGESENAFHLASTAVKQGRQSQFLSHSISLGGLLVRNDLKTALEDEGADCTLNGLYLGMDHQLVDNHTVIDHVKPHGSSNELYKGILSGKAHGVFNGKILVRAGAAKTQARQTNKNLLLSDDAVINTTPLLEIFHNDVKCNHGATIGRLDEAQVFYLRSRGIDDDRARSLLTYAFASELIGHMKIPSLRVRLEEIISLRLMKGHKTPEVL